MLFANILSFISTALLIYSMFINSKKKMLLVQVIQYIVSAVGNLLGGSIAAAGTNVISVIRNGYFANANGLAAMIAFSAAYITVEVFTNTLGVIGFLPVIACVEYTICTHFASTAQTLRYGALINLALWLAHDIYIKLYGFVLTDIILIIVTIAAIIKFYKKEDNEKEDNEKEDND